MIIDFFEVDKWIERSSTSWKLWNWLFLPFRRSVIVLKWPAQFPLLAQLWLIDGMAQIRVSRTSESHFSCNQFPLTYERCKSNSRKPAWGLHANSYHSARASISSHCSFGQLRGLIKKFCRCKRWKSRDATWDRPCVVQKVSRAIKSSKSIEKPKSDFTSFCLAGGFVKIPTITIRSVNKSLFGYHRPDNLCNNQRYTAMK